MSFLSKIFKKKPGGSFIGNLFRKVASSATGGLIGSGQNKIQNDQNALYTLSEDAYKKEYGMSKKDGAARMGIDWQDTTPKLLSSSSNNNTGTLVLNPNTGVYENQDSTLGKLFSEPFDLGKYIKLPSVPVGADNSWIKYIFIALAVFLIIPRLLPSKKY